MNGPIPVFNYGDTACDLYPELAPQIREGIAEYYTDQSERVGEYLIQKGILNIDQHKLILLAQKAHRKLLSEADKEELFRLQSVVHLRTMSGLEELGLLLRSMKP